MGLKSWLFGDFIDTIEFNNKDTESIIWQYPLEDKDISYGAQIVVDEQQIAAIVIDDGIFDALPYGSYKLNRETLPNIASTLNWDDEHDEPFKAQIYFLNKDNVTLHWHTKEPILLHDRDNSIAELDAKGTFKTHLSNVALFLEYILDEKLQLKSNTIDKLIEDNLVEALTHRSSSIYKLASDKVEFSYFLKSRLANTFTKNGLILEELDTHHLNVEQKLPNMTGIVSENENYYIIKNSKPVGPYTKEKIKEMINKNELIPASYIWKQGLKDWAKVKDLFVVE